MGPWRSEPAQLFAQSDAYRESVFPSGRQALSETLRRLGLGRPDRVAVPEWSSMCVFSAVGAVATPVPISEAHEPAAVLLYDQWGWPRSFASIRARWPRTRIVHDCVDTADLTFSGADAQIWSLSKVLGLNGGGLARIGQEFVPFTPDPGHEEFCRQLNSLGHPEIAKWHARWRLPEPERAAATDLARAYAGERERRQANLAASAAELPSWMDASQGPGLCPLRISNPEAGRRWLLEQGFDFPVYHFDFAGDPMAPDYQRCLALPLHGQLTPAIVARLSTALYRGTFL